MRSNLDNLAKSLIRQSGGAGEDTGDAREAAAAAAAGRSTARPPSAPPQPPQPRPPRPSSSSSGCGKSASKCRRDPPGSNPAEAEGEGEGAGESRTPVAPWLLTSLEDLFNYGRVPYDSLNVWINSLNL